MQKHEQAQQQVKSDRLYVCLCESKRSPERQILYPDAHPSRLHPKNKVANQKTKSQSYVVKMKWHLSFFFFFWKHVFFKVSKYSNI